MNVRATFSEAIRLTSLSFVLRDSNNVIVSSVLTYDDLTRTTTLDPDADLAAQRTYTATISAADLAGNQMTPVAWSFTTATTAFQETNAFTGLTQPTVVQFATDGRVFVAEKSGLIKVFQDLADTTPTIFADLTTKVHNFWDRGLLGMVLDPEFPTRPYVYVLYTHDAAIGGTAPRWGTAGVSSDPCPNPPGATGDGCVVSGRLSRLTAAGNVMVGPEQVLIEDWFQQYPSHSIGTLAFGADGALYASAGDGASFNFVDYGQDGTPRNPGGDPPVPVGGAQTPPTAEGGALRSQDLRTPADPVTLDGSIIRIDPSTGLPLSRTSPMVIRTSTVDGNGVRSFSVTSEFQDETPTIVRVLEPTNPAPGKPHRFLYVLPVEAGVALNSVFSDGLEELRLLDVHNLYNVTLIAPSFHIEPWYGDHATDGDRRLESFIVRDLVPFGDSFAAPGERPRRWVIGFSKSGFGALSLILRNPNVFSAAASWDAPAQFTDLSPFPGMGENFGTEANFDRYEIPTLVSLNGAAFRQQNRIWISGDESYWNSHMLPLHNQMEQAGMLHTFVQDGDRSHNWYSGWLAGAIGSLDANSGPLSGVDANSERIVAHGLRNPFRFTFRPNTNELWVGDVGWNSWEEINRIQDPADSLVENFGWPCYEGAGSLPGYDTADLNICEQLYVETAADTKPFYTYSHNTRVVPGEACGVGSSSISGMAFYDGDSYPASFDGALFFADYARNCIWVMYAGPTGVPDPSTISTFVAGASGPVDLKIGPDGDLYYVDFRQGTIRRIRYSSGNLAPAAVLAASQETGPLPLTVSFDATGSTDPEAGPLSYAWDLDGDGAYDDSTSVQPTYTYTTSGTRLVQLRITDNQGLSDFASVFISAGNTAPTVSIDMPTVGATWQVSELVGFRGTATDVEDGTIPASRMFWSLILHHCPSTCHAHPLQDFVGVREGFFSAPDHEYPSHLELRLTAIDSGGAQTTANVLLYPRTSTLTFESSPAGLQLTTGSGSATAPFSRTVIVGSSHSMGGPSPQVLAGSTYQFGSWSDGGAQTHNVTAPTGSAIYVASYALVSPPGLVGAYGFNEGAGPTAGDQSGSGNPGTISGANWTAAGKFGGALSFDGADDWVTVANASSLDLTSGMTLEAWVYPTSAGGIRDILLKEGSGVDVYNLYARNWRGVPESNVFVGGTNRTAEGAVLPTNEWTHVAGTYDGTTLRLFINGVQAASSAVAGSIAVSTGPLRIGGNSLWGEYFQGLIDEIRIYNRALTQPQIEADMNTAVGVPTSDTTPPVRSNGQPTGTLAAGTTQTTLSLTTDEAAACRYALTPGVAYGSMPTVFTTTGGTTHSTPVSGLTNGGSYSHYVRCQDTAAPPNANGTDYTISFSVATPADATPPVRLNGQPTGTLPAGTTQATLSLTTDEAATCRYALTPGVAYGSMPTVFTTTGGTAHSTPVSGLTNGGSYSYYVRCQDTAAPPNPNGTDYTVSFSVATAPPPSSGLVGAYGFNDGAGGTVTDASGSGNPGTISGATWTGAGKHGGALSFDGVNDWVTVADAGSLDLTSGMTLEAWVYSTSASGVRDILLKEGSGVDVYNLYAGNWRGVPESNVFVGGTNRTAEGAALPTNVWTHVAGTYDGTTLRLFTNGVQAASAAVAGPIPVGTGPVRIGGNSIWGEYFQGLIDEVRIYNRALTQLEIQTDMNTPISP